MAFVKPPEGVAVIENRIPPFGVGVGVGTSGICPSQAAIAITITTAAKILDNCFIAQNIYVNKMGLFLLGYVKQYIKSVMYLPTPANINIGV